MGPQRLNLFYTKYLSLVWFAKCICNFYHPVELGFFMLQFFVV